MWPDNETDRDLLGFQVHADLLRAVILDPTMLPTTIGVFGDWGGGKTSVLKMLEQSLEFEKCQDAAQKEELEHVACLYINGWLFEGYDDAKSALITSILEQLKEHKRFGPIVKDRVGELLASVDLMRLAKWSLRELAVPVATGALTGGAALLPLLVETVLKAGGKAAEKAISEESEGKKEKKSDGQSNDINSNVRTFREKFRKLLKDSNIRTLVVIIDDLDRCAPKRILENLEAIKLFLNVEGTAFVIGADPRIVRYAVTREYGEAQRQVDSEGTSTGTDLSTDYLEKVIQIPYYLPKLSPGEVEAYMSLLFCIRCIPDPWSDLRQAYVEHLRTDRYSPFGKAEIEAVMKEHVQWGDLETQLLFANGVAPILTEGLKGNPRQIKRFLNALMLRQRLGQVAGLQLQPDTLAKLMVLEYVRPSQFNELGNIQSLENGKPAKLREMEEWMQTGEAEKMPSDWKTPTLQRWLKTPPLLADVDLRDYFWVARDRLESMLNNATLIPPVIRQALQGLLDELEATRQTSMAQVLLFTPDQKLRLLEELVGQIRRRPGQSNLYLALRDLVKNDVDGAMDALEEVATTVEPQNMPPNFGTYLLDLQTTKYGPRISVLISNLKKGRTPVAAALEGD